MKRFLALVACSLLSLLMSPARAHAEPTTSHLTLDGQRVLQVTAEILAQPEDVWRIWTTPEGFRRVFDRKLTIDARPGGPYEIEWAPDAPAGQRGSETCKVLTVDPHRVFSFEWNAPPNFDEVRNGRKHWVVLTFEARGTGTLLTLRTTGFGDTEQWNGVYDYFTVAWPWVVGQIEAHFAPAAATSKGANMEESRDAWVYLIVGFNREDLISTMTEDEKAVIGEHFTYLQRLTLDGQVVLAGPCTDMKGPGIVVFHAPEEASARRIMESDPAVRAGIFKAELHPMRLSLLRERDRISK